MNMFSFFNAYYLVSRSLMGLNYSIFKLGWPSKEIKLSPNKFFLFMRLKPENLFKRKR